VVAKSPPRSRLRLISARRSLHELELRTLYYDPGYCLSSGGSPAVLAMTIRSNTDLGRRAETHLATITATSNFILFHAGHRKLGMSNRNRDNLLVGESRKRVQEIIADNLTAVLMRENYQGFVLRWTSP
jgi:predicted deacetylase